MCNSRNLLKISSSLSKDEYVVRNWTHLFQILLPSDHGLRMQLEKNFYEMKMSIDSVFNHILTHWMARNGAQSVPKLLQILEQNKYQSTADLIREIMQEKSSEIANSSCPKFQSEKGINLRNISKLSRSLANDRILAQNWETFATALLPQDRGVAMKQGVLHFDSIHNVLTLWISHNYSKDVTVAKLVDILIENEFVSAAEIVMKLEPTL